MKNQTKNHAAEQTNYGRLHQLCALVLEGGGIKIGWALIKKSIVDHISKHVQLTEMVLVSKIRKLIHLHLHQFDRWKSGRHSMGTISILFVSVQQSQYLLGPHELIPIPSMG